MGQLISENISDLWHREARDFRNPFGPIMDIAGKNATFYVGNNRALEALARNAPGPLAIAAMTQPIWLRIAELNMAVGFERDHPRKTLRTSPPIVFLCHSHR